MTKFSGTKKRPRRANVAAAVRTTHDRTLTYEGGLSYARDAESDLFLLAVTNMVGEDTFYERAGARDARFVDLVHQVTATNPTFISGGDVDEGKIGFAQYLRATTERPAAPPAATYSAAITTAADRMSIVWRRYWARPTRPATRSAPAMNAGLDCVTLCTSAAKRASRSAARS